MKITTPDTEVQSYLKSLTVLYVEDEEMSRELFSESLSRLVGTLISVENGSKALEAYRQKRPDIIISDIRMPVMDGLAMASKIREFDRSVPIILLTAFDQGDYLIKSINIGIDKYVTKPVDAGKFQEALLSCANRLLIEEKLKQAQELLKDKRQRLIYILEGTRAGTWEWNIQTGKIIINESWAELIGYHLEEISPVSLDTWIHFVHPDDLNRYNELLKKHFCSDSGSFECEVRMRHKNGQWVWILSRGKVASWSEEGKPLWMFGTHQDISERKKIEEAVIRAKKEWELTFDSVSDLISIIDTSHTIMRVNRAMAVSCGLTVQEMIGRKCHEVMHRMSEPIANCPYGKAMKDNCEHTEEVEEKWLNRIFDITVSPIFESGGSFNHCVHIARDITERKLMEEQLRRAKAAAEALSKADSLTGLANRRHFDAVLAQEYSRHIRSGLGLSLIMLDIDYFKNFNDAYGHVAGDECLRQVARVIADCANRITDLAARYGGEEFICILPETDLRGALLIAENIRQGLVDLAIPNVGSTVSSCVTASLGVLTAYGIPDKSETDIVTQADELLYKAKSLGRNRMEHNEVNYGPRLGLQQTQDT